MKRYLPGILVSTLLVGLTIAPAQAFHCPLDVKAIDNGLAHASLSAETKAEVQKLRDEGEQLHKSGAHKEAVDKLSEAMRLLLNNL